MRGFAFSVDMLYGVIVVVLLFSILTNAIQPAAVSQNVFLFIQAKDAAMDWFYRTPVADSALLSQCPSDDGLPSTFLKPCACDSAFRPAVTTSLLDPSDPSSWVTQTVCVVAP